MIMPQSFEAFVSILLSQLTAQERDNGVAYAVEAQIGAGTRLLFPGLDIEVPCDSHLAFIDREPTANWGHAARYVFIGFERGEVRSFEARLPPFQTEGGFQWRIVYKAHGVPDAAVASSLQTRPRT
jgi:hypothetical protein